MGLRVGAAIAAAVFLAVASHWRAGAMEHDCFQEGTCPNHASCEGDFFDREGCQIQCFVRGGAPGEIERAGSACCAAGGDCDGLLEG